jgi:DNA/RNA endonuclease YhcR with UshA esterase domain
MFTVVIVTSTTILNKVKSINTALETLLDVFGQEVVINERDGRRSKLAVHSIN